MQRVLGLDILREFGDLIRRHRSFLLKAVIPAVLLWCFALFLVNLLGNGQITLRDLARQVLLQAVPMSEYPWLAQFAAFLLWWAVLPAGAVILHRVLMEKTPVWPGFGVVLRYAMLVCALGLLAWALKAALFSALGTTWFVWRDDRLPMVRFRHTRASGIFFFWCFILMTPALVAIAIEEQLPRLRALIRWSVPASLLALFYAAYMYFEIDIANGIGNDILRSSGLTPFLFLFAFLQTWKLVVLHLFATAVYRVYRP
ncbi:MAG: hypothetical protein AAF718_11440 [Pseudomonadota bacterium]